MVTGRCLVLVAINCNIILSKAINYTAIKKKKLINYAP